MFRTLVLISLLVSSLTLVSGVQASVIYAPGAMIAMTGSNSDVRFDVASALISNSSTESAPALDTTSLKFTGTFYGSGIGWIVFATGANQVSLSCSEALNHLTANCTLTWLGWNENVWDIDFSQVKYNPTTGLLSGSVLTFAWDISLTGIALPLRPVTLNESTLVANHSATLSVSGAWMYDAGTLGWNGSVNTSLDPQNIVGTNGIYNNVDLSLASDTYTITIEDSNGSITTLSAFIVTANLPNTTLESGHYADIYCGANPTDTINCPDGAPRSATTLTQLPVWPVIADGADAYTLTLKARDRYGNRVKSGNIRIQYTTTVKNIQTEDNINYLFPVCPDATTISIFTDACGEWTYNATLTPADITYTIASTAPTNATNQVQLDSIIYNWGPDISVAWWRIPLSFTPLFTAAVATADTPIVNTPHTFETDVSTHKTTTIIPTIITTMLIGDGSAAEWRSLSSSPTQVCSNYPFTLTTDPLCDWSGVSSIATPSVSDFAYTGTYIRWVSSTDTTTLGGYIYYNNGVSDILYSMTNNSIAAATAASQRVRVLGQSGEWVGGGASTRVELIASIREQVALLSRNRTNYDDVNYAIYTGDHTINPTDLDGATGIKAKRSIITIGGDIRIGANINPRDYPIALIALTDSSSRWGNIIIDGTVTDIHSSLIAEHAIRSGVSDSQLYIHGSLVSANPPREIPPTGCPYFAPSGCVRSDYDLPGSRDAYAALTDKTSKSSIGGSTYLSPLVIEWDPRIIRDPAPAMSK
jgi:hypothetical protein